jgi:hypothetical protein
MLQRVALGQVRFNVPGLAVDARGVAIGKQLAVRFAAIDRLVGFFRALAAEQSLDDLQPGLRIVYARGTAGTREAVVFLPASSSAAQVGDVVSRAARLVGGQCFTGGGKHFVQFRDAAAPLGYDVAAPSQEAADFVLYGIEQEVAYRIESELPFSRLLLRLSLQRAPQGTTWMTDGPLLLVARRGLGPLVAEYLHRARRPPRGAGAGAEPALRVAAAACETPAGGAFEAPRSFWLFRVEGAPPRMRGLLTQTPGLEPYVPLTDNVAVAAGYRHPIALEACRGFLPSDRLTLFSARGAGVIEIVPAPIFTAVEDVVRLRTLDTRDAERVTASAAGRPEVAVPLRLEASAEGRHRPVAALVPWARVPWLRRLCYALPAAALRGYRVAVVDRGVLVLAGNVLEGVPFGTLLETAAPDVLVPLGTRLRPAAAPELIAERLGASGGALVVFPALGASPFRVPAELVEPLDRRALSVMGTPEDAASAGGLVAAPPSVEPVEIENEPLGPMPLWGLEG